MPYKTDAIDKAKKDGAPITEKEKKKKKKKEKFKFDKFEMPIKGVGTN